jgi:opacity protein-like surface antigen
MAKFTKAIGSLVLATAGAAAFATAAAAADIVESAPPENLGSIYVRGDIGWSMLDLRGDDDSALTAGVGLGYMWSDILRTDVRLDWSGNYDIGTETVDATTLLANAYIDIPLNLSFINPYVGAGVGYGWVNSDGGEDDSGFTYSLMGGATWNLSDSMALDTGYRFRDIAIDGSNFKDHSLTAGILFRF